MQDVRSLPRIAYCQGFLEERQNFLLPICLHHQFDLGFLSGFCRWRLQPAFRYLEVNTGGCGRVPQNSCTEKNRHSVSRLSCFCNGNVGSLYRRAASLVRLVWRAPACVRHSSSSEFRVALRRPMAMKTALKYDCYGVRHLCW